ncbi:chaplin family protein [Streptomyces sp. CA-288835]|uniref:chaplin n=1 Tax=Streptomyces sp. CA-288835 TaxID=3240069 RepID=UPI003D902378
MRQVTRKGLMTVAAATGVLAVTGGYAHADSDGSASDSSGVLSGNSVEAPIDVQANVCGNTVNIVGLLNPAVGNSCVNEGGNSGNSGNNSSGGSQAGGHTSDSSGIGSGNHVQAPVDVPINVCGNGVNVAGIGNEAAGNDCANSGGHETSPPGHGEQTPPGNPEQPGTPQQPPSADTEQVGAEKPNSPDTQAVAQPKGSAQLAATGSELPIGLALPVGAGALLMGAVLYRKARAAA